MICTDKRNRKLKVNSSDGYRVLADCARLKVTEEIQKLIDSGVIPDRSGIYLTEDDEDMPIYGPVSPIEKVISRKMIRGNRSGSRIVLTKDNYGHRATGVGGLGGTMCEAIDIVAGSLSCEKKLFTGATMSRANFITDAARIYLTERGDIQSYFAVGSPDNAISIDSNLKSGIGIKADHTLVIGRERVRILVGLSNADGDPGLVNNDSNPASRIELAHISEEKSQPAVLGDALVNYLEKLKDDLMTLYEATQKLESDMMQMQMSFASHQHQGAGLGYVQIFPDPKLAIDAGMKVPKFLNVTRENITNVMNQYIISMQHLGIAEQAIQGSIGEHILSSTVYIGS